MTRGWDPANNHHPVASVASFVAADLIKEITNLRGDNVAVVCGGNGEERVV